MRRQVLVGSLAVLLVVAGFPPAISATDTSDPLLAQPDGFDRTTFEITVYQNGSADWVVTHSRRLENETERQRFEDYAERFRTEETDLYRNFVSRSERLVAIGENATGREMAASDFARDAYVNVTASLADRGTVELAYRWDGFARTDGDRVIVRDVFEGAFYIGESQSLVFVRGPELAFARVEPEPTSKSLPDSLVRSETVSWEGEQEFGQSRPYVELGPRELVAGPEGRDETDTRTDGPTTAGDESTEGDGGTDAGVDGEDAATLPTSEQDADGLMWVAGALLVFVFAVAGAVLHFGRPSLPWDGSGTETTTDSAGSESAEPEAAAPIPDEELLSDSDRVLKLLEENGGRMKQVNIVEETEWSKSKVSMLLSDMEEDGEISKLRVGRENIISLAGEEPEAAGSPFDDDE